MRVVVRPMPLHHKIPKLFPDFCQKIIFPWLISKFHDFSLTLKKKNLFPWPWKPWTTRPLFKTGTMYDYSGILNIYIYIYIRRNNQRCTACMIMKPLTGKTVWLLYTGILDYTILYNALRNGYTHVLSYQIGLSRF